MPLIDLNKSVIPGEIARDSEVTAAIASHVSAIDPHAQYLTQTEGDGRYRQTTTGIIFLNSSPAVCRSSGAITGGGSGDRGLEVQSDSPDSAYMVFHIGTQIAFRFGIDGLDSNLKIGGFSLGSNSYRVWHEIFGIPVWQSPSDARLKNSIKPITNALDLILKMNPVRFRYKAETRKTGLFGDLSLRCKPHYGFLAQEFPIKDLQLTKKEGEMGIDYIEIIPFLVKAIQELQEQINELKQKNTS